MSRSRPWRDSARVSRLTLNASTMCKLFVFIFFPVKAFCSALVGAVSCLDSRIAGSIYFIKIIYKRIILLITENCLCGVSSTDPHWSTYYIIFREKNMFPFYYFFNFIKKKILYFFWIWSDNKILSYNFQVLYISFITRGATTGCPKVISMAKIIYV